MHFHTSKFEWIWEEKKYEEKLSGIRAWSPVTKII